MKKRDENTDISQKSKTDTTRPSERSARKSYSPTHQQKFNKLQQFRFLLDQINDIILFINVPSGEIHDVNNSACEHLQYDREDILNKNIRDLIPIKSVPGIEKMISDITFEQTGKMTFEADLNRRDGTSFPAEINVSRVKFINDLHVVAVARNLTKRKKMEEELLKAEKLESIGILVGGIAHDFNNILTAAMGNISLARMDAEAGKDNTKLLFEAEKALNRATNLTYQLLTFSKGGAPLKRTADIVEAIIESASFALRGSNVICKYNIADDLYYADFDRGLISQVINNLVINADQAMPDGGTINIICENITLDEDSELPLNQGVYIKISIVDNGTGIPDDIKKNIFDPFFTTKPNGSGLGLSSTYSIVKNHQGFIQVDSSMDSGTRFDIYLPTSDKVIKKVISKDKTDIKGSGNVLVVDDEKPIRNISKIILKGFGYKVETAKDGETAKKIYKKAIESNKPFDLVILDLTIPGGKGGKDIITELTAIDPNVKAVVSSGYSTDPVMANYREYGFVGRLEKPFRVDTLGRMIKEIQSEAAKKDTP